ncbi:hypothetical protein VTK73DRAFT_1512 [Phialemonium thermophilum]|uniref:Elongation factor 1-alpha n=1 Tax=Phialemonium thermophilum TaxID=223376 RepID=A0ABR3VTB2_9PEZI
MADLNSWEDDPAAQDENLARQTQQQMNLGNNQQQQQQQQQPPSQGFPRQGFQPHQQQQGGFRPGAASFQPTAQTFQPGQGYGGNFAPPYQQPYYGGQPYYPQGGQQAFSQYGAQGYAGVYAQDNYNQGYGPYRGYQQQQQQQQQPQQQQQQRTQQQPQQPSQTQPNAKPTPTIAKRPTAEASSGASPAAASPAPKTTVSREGGAKVLSIGAEPAQQKTKVLSIGVPAAPKEDAKEQTREQAKKEEAKTEGTPEAAAKITATKAIDKTEAKASGGGGGSSSGKTSPTPSSGRSSPSRAAAAAHKAAVREADAEIYGKEHVNIIFIGHVDAGKSTLGGAILYVTGMVDQRTLDKYRRDAKEMGRETWYLSWALDLTPEERSKGKTVEVGRGYFETEKRRYSILDAPGHKTYVPNMIGGASQADVGILVISARKGEYETGFEKGGQTREHAMLAKTQGVNKLVVVINKMDDPTVNWSHERYLECTTKLAQFLRGTGYNLKTDVFFMPIAAQQTIGIKDRALERKINAPFMMAVAGKYRDMGTMIEGKIEAGVVKKGMTLTMMPNKQNVEVAAVYGETEEEMGIAQCGDQVRMRLRGIEEEDILPGFVLCSPKRLVHCVSEFEAQIRILELKSILTAGFNCVLHVHAAIEEVTFAALLHMIKKGTNKRSKVPPTHAKRGDSIIARLQVTGGAGSVCVERFEDYPQMGRFTLRDQGQTIAIGKITKLITNDSN